MNGNQMLFSSFQEGKQLKSEYTVVFENLFSNQRLLVLLVHKKAIHASAFETPTIYCAIISLKFT